MKRFLIKLAALLLAAVTVFAFAACDKKGSDKPDVTDGSLSKAENERVIELARTFRIFGAYDFSKGFDVRQYEYLVYSLFCWRLSESDVKGYGRVEYEEANKAVEAVVGQTVDSNGFLRTQYRPAEIQVIYTLNDRYYIQRADDSAYTCTVTNAVPLKDEAGERIGVTATVKVSGADGDVCFVFELLDSAENVFSIKKCEIQSYE